MLLVLCVSSKINYSEQLARCRQRVTCKQKELSEAESSLIRNSSSSAGNAINIRYNNNNNNNIVICKAHKVSSNAESEAPAVARWAALVGYAKRTVLRRRLKVSAVGESIVSIGKSFQTVGAR